MVVSFSPLGFEIGKNTNGFQMKKERKKNKEAKQRQAKQYVFFLFLLTKLAI